MKEVVEVYRTCDEYNRELSAVCDSEETAMEYAKTVHNWFSPCSLFEEIQESPSIKKFYIKKRRILTIDDVKKKQEIWKINGLNHIKRETNIQRNMYGDI